MKYVQAYAEEIRNKPLTLRNVGRKKVDVCTPSPRFNNATKQLLCINIEETDKETIEQELHEFNCSDVKVVKSKGENNMCCCLITFDNSDNSRDAFEYIEKNKIFGNNAFTTYKICYK